MEKKNVTPEDLVIENIIEIFEEFLNSYGIDIPNCTKELFPENKQNIIGDDYGYLVGRITEMFKFWHVSCNNEAGKENEHENI